MPKPVSDDLKNFLERFPADMQTTVLYLRQFVLDLIPDCNELLYDKANLLVIGFGLSDGAGNAFCSLAVYGKHINFGLLRGSEIQDAKKLLKGNGSLYRFVRVEKIEDLPAKEMKPMLADAWINAVSRMKGEQTLKGASIVKLISPKKRWRVE